MYVVHYVNSTHTQPLCQGENAQSFLLSIPHDDKIHDKIHDT